MGLRLVPVLAAVAWCEVGAVRRRGQTFGKGLAGIRVVRYEDPDVPSGHRRLCDLRQSILRWVIPHGAGLLVGVVSLLVAIPRIKDYGGHVGVGAGTIVEIGGELPPAESGDPDRSPPPDGSR